MTTYLGAIQWLPQVYSWPVHISRWNGSFRPSFWTLVNSKKFPYTTMGCLTASCEPFQKRVTGRFGDICIFPPINRSTLKVKYNLFLKRQVSETLFPNLKCECTSGELPSNCHWGEGTHVLQAWCKRTFTLHSRKLAGFTPSWHAFGRNSLRLPKLWNQFLSMQVPKLGFGFILPLT